jgi:hypothetical protein
MIRKFVTTFFAIAICCGCSNVEETNAPKGWQTQEDNWYSVTIDGAKSGWTHELVEVDTETGNLKSSNVQNMTLSRGGMEISISVTSTFLETADGNPISVESIQETMGQSQTTRWDFGDTVLTMTTAAGGEPMVKNIPLPEESWLTPQAVKRLFIEKMKEGAFAMTYQTMAPELGPSAITVVMTKKGESTQTVLGNEIRISSWETVNDKMPIISTEFYTTEGQNIGSSMNAGFGLIENKLMFKNDALSPVNEVPELMVSLFVEPNKPIDIEATQLAMTITSKDGSAIKLPSVGSQHATNNEDGSVSLVIDLDRLIAATKNELAEEKYLDASAICDGTDEAVIAIATDALAKLPSDANDMEKALALRAKVFEFIEEKDMSTAFASASQTARDKKGDCSEHGVLLCGVLRASGIPSRGVMGMVYVPKYGAPNGVFGWHMWSQALVDGKWIDLDATLQSPYSVGHIATVTTSLSDEDFAADMSGIIATIGNLDVEVVEDDSEE